jgi:hypothetical protein
MGTIPLTNWFFRQYGPRRKPLSHDPPSCDPDDLDDAKAKLRRVARTTIGKELAALYEIPQDLSPELRALLMQLNQNGDE